VDKEFTYRALFDQYAKPGEKFDEEWIERFDSTIAEEGVGTHSWNSGNPGAGAGVTYIYLFRGLFFTDTDFGIDGPYEEFTEAAEDVNLLTVTSATERIWVDYKVDPDSGTDDDGDEDDDDDDE